MLGQSEDSANCPGSQGRHPGLLNTGLDGGPGTKQNPHITPAFLLSSQDRERSSRTLSSSHRGGAGIRVCPRLLG